MGGPDLLQAQVLSHGFCAGCGACTSICPYLNLVQGRAVLLEPCGREEGRCYSFCPRTEVDLPLLEERVFGNTRADPALGVHSSVVKARARRGEVRERAQYGGTVTSLVLHALREGRVDSFVLTGSRDGLLPQPLLARAGEEVLSCAGSRYLLSPSVGEVVRLLREGEGERGGFVGTPCQVLALRKIQAYEREWEVSRVGPVIGLFCTWALSHRAEGFFREKLEGRRVRRLDVPPPPANLFVIETEGGRLELPLDRVREFIPPSCRVCFDMTAELADLSVGMVEGEEEWNTVILRSEEGRRLFREAVEEGEVEEAPLERERLEHLREASLNKKRRAREEGERLGIRYLKGVEG
ncbi:MAG: hypothetical protein DSO04_05065 [Hadesarchaea archaeon]|nr:MAG: hypothetical protein DSO04_05065 [Hadesarchaea archaeon]